jgi:hypothetical protein
MRTTLYLACTIIILSTTTLAQTFEWNEFAYNHFNKEIVNAHLDGSGTKLMILEDSIYEMPSSVMSHLLNSKVFEYTNDSWHQLGSTIFTLHTYNQGYYSYSLNGKCIARSFHMVNKSDSTYNNFILVYEYNTIQKSWLIKGDTIKADSCKLACSRPIDINKDGTIIAFNTYKIVNDTIQGWLKVMKFENQIWKQIGTNINGKTKTDFVGNSFSLNSDGTRLAISTTTDSYGSIADTGYIKIYEYLDDDWMQLGSDIPGINFDNRTNYTISLNKKGNIVAIGAPLFSTDASWGKPYGQVRIFEYSTIDNDWVQLGQNIKGRKWSLTFKKEEKLGRTVCLDSSGYTIALGSNTTPRVYEYNDSTWVKKGSFSVKNCNYYESKVSISENAKTIAFTNSCKHSLNTFIYDSIDESLKHYIYLTMYPIGAGYINGGGIYKDGDTVSINATGINGYIFDQWKDNDKIISPNSNYSFIANNSIELTAYFSKSTINPKITFRVNMSNEDNFYKVGIKGSWDNWNSITVLHEDNGDYIGIKEVTSNRSYEYKYVKLDSNIEITQWEDIPSAECTVGEYKNRFVNVSNNNIDINTVCFNSCNGCTTTLIDKKERDNLIIFPNPNSGIFSITSNNIKFIEVFNILGGKVPVELNIGCSKSIVNLSKYKHGIFYVRIHTKDKIFTKKVLVK